MGKSLIKIFYSHAAQGHNIDSKRRLDVPFSKISFTTQENPTIELYSPRILNSENGVLKEIF